MATVHPEVTAVSALREHLLNHLPAKCAAINAERGAALRAGTPEPYAVTAGMTLNLGTTPGSEVARPLTPGSRTAAQVAADLSGITGLTASVDSAGRLLVSASTAPVAGPSEVFLAGDDTGANLLFGWNP